MFASTNVFTASAEFGATPSVETVIDAPLIVSVADAWPVTVPGVKDTNVIVHWPFSSVLGPAVVQEPVGSE